MKKLAGALTLALLAASARADLAFEQACAPGPRTTIAAVGDVLLHSPLQIQGLSSKQGFTSLWNDVERLLSQADVTYANLEGPVAGPVGRGGREVSDPGKRFDNSAYTTYPMFNYHPQIISDLLRSGIDVVSTANNHAMDRSSLGVDRTIDHLREAGLLFTGTRRSNEETPWYTVTRSDGFTIAWIACAEMTNGLPDSKNQVLDCYGNSPVEGIVQKLSRERGIDAVIVTPHWGIEYQHQPRPEQKAFAHRMLEAGATAIIGSHPHVVQPWEKIRTSDGREGFVIYSMGNFVSGQSGVDKVSSLVLYLGLTRTREGRVVINGVRYVPLMMTHSNGWNLEAADPSNRSSSATRALLARLLGADRVMDSRESLVTNPECR